MHTILYMVNPDPIFYAEMDQLIIDSLNNFDIRIISAQLDELSFIVKQDDICFFKAGEKIDFDAFLSYGYMAPKHYQQFAYFNFAAHSAGKITLHHPTTESILQNKLLQYLKFGENQVPFPTCGAAFSVNQFQEFKRKFQSKSILKSVSGYEGTGVILCNSFNESAQLHQKSLWKGEQTILQEFINDSIGRSIRVLVIGGKAVSVTEFQDDEDFKSNSYSDDFQIESKMNSEKKEEYFQLAEKACAAIDSHLTIGGVDILDSQKNGLQVLEINSWPEMTFSQDATRLPIFEYFSTEIVDQLNQREKRLKRAN